MINNTDSIYSQLVPLEYPKVGETPSACKVGVVTLTDAKTTWMNLPGDPSQNYLVRMEFVPSTNNLLIQQLNRKQNKNIRLLNTKNNLYLIFTFCFSVILNFIFHLENTCEN